jgi:hypothetical protein
MKTAVEWLWDELECLIPAECQEAYVQAKEMEKKQSEKMYSEEEVKLAYNEGQVSIISANYIRTEEWFEQFKKK